MTFRTRKRQDQDRASRRAFFYADNPNYSLHSVPTILIPELWIKKRALSYSGERRVLATGLGQANYRF